MKFPSPSTALTHAYPGVSLSLRGAVVSERNWYQPGAHEGVAGGAPAGWEGMEKGFQKWCESRRGDGDNAFLKDPELAYGALGGGGGEMNLGTFDFLVV